MQNGKNKSTTKPVSQAQHQKTKDSLTKLKSDYTSFKKEVISKINKKGK